MVEARIATECPGGGAPPAPARGPTLVDLDEFSTLCSTGHTPQILTGVFLRILQNHFSNPDYIEDDALKDNVVRLKPDDTTEGIPETGILIEPSYKFNPIDFGARPAIFIKRNGLEVQRYGINDGLTVGLGRDKEGNVKTYEGDYHTVGVLGSHTLFCVSRSGAEAEVLGYEVFREIQQFAPIVRRDLGLKKLAVPQISELSKLEEHDQHFVVGVVVGWAYFEKWRIVPDAPWLKSLHVELRPT